MEIRDLKSGMLIRDGRKLLKVSTVYPEYVTMQVLLEGRELTPPKRTSVRRYSADDVFLFFDEPTKTQIQRMDEVYGGSPAFSTLL